MLPVKKQRGQMPTSGLLRACLNLKMEKYINKDSDSTNSNTVKNVSIADEQAAAFKGTVWIFLRWVYMRGLSIVGVLPTVDGGWHATSLGKHGLGTEAVISIHALFK